MTIEADIKMSPECASLFKALRGFMAECAAPKKTGFNPHFKSKYANLEEVLDTAKPVLDKHGLTLTQFPCGGTADTVGLATMLAHDSGQWIVATVQMPLSKRDPQAAGSAISYARRYSAMAALGMAAEDDDGEQASGRGRDERRPPSKPKSLDDVVPPGAGERALAPSVDAQRRAPPGGAAERPKDGNGPRITTATREPTSASTGTTSTTESLVLYPRTGEMLQRSEVIEKHNAMSVAYHKKMKLKPGPANQHGIYEPSVPMPKMPAGKHEGDPVGIVPEGYLRKFTMQDAEFLRMDPGLVLWVSFCVIEHELARDTKEAANAAE